MLFGASAFGFNTAAEFMLRFVRPWPLLLPVVAMLLLFLFMVGPGFGGTSDSTYYLWAAKTWRDDGSLLAPDGQPYRY